MTPPPPGRAPPSPEKPVSSLAELRRRVPGILEQVNAEPQLAMAAAVNPLLALDELGVVLTPELRAEVELLVRFSRDDARRHEELTAQVTELAGRHVDHTRAEDLHTLLTHELKVQLPDGVSCLPLPFVPGGKAAEDPLSRLDPAAHPILGPLIELRALEARQPRLADPELYAEVREGHKKLPISRIQGRLHQVDDDG
jgi:hypothetical protein